MVYKWLNNSHSCIFGCHCLLCLAPIKNSKAICQPCEDDLHKNTNHCIVCSGAIESGHNEQPGYPLVCGKCQKHPPAFTTSFIPFTYSAPLKQLISRMKFQRSLYYLPLLANLFVDELKQRQGVQPECIIPVPLHPTRQRRRGFNQSLELAKLVSKYTEIPVQASHCVRQLSTAYQSGLNALERKKNIKNAFKVTKPLPFQHVAIFDDVVTTGATVNELARVLKLEGVEFIEVWALARTSS